MNPVPGVLSASPLVAMQWQDGLGLVLAVLAVLYLVFVLINPERF